jgi:glycosyltransferase involved in cell wall biosynthesis
VNADVSVVISTRNRAELLKGALDAVLRQSYASFEVIVVDNGSTDSTGDVLAIYQNRHPQQLRSVREDRVGVSYGRNRGLMLSRAPLVAFTDDDVRVGPDWLQQGVRWLAEHADDAYVGGPVLPQWTSPPPPWLTREHWAPLAALDYGNVPFIVPTDRPVCLITANLIVRRAALDQVGWFNPEFYRCQDRELMLRLWQARLFGTYRPEMVASTTVSPERLQRTYHRRWHSRHGRFLARMPLREQQTGSGCHVSAADWERTICGAPLCEYRALFAHLSAWAWHAVQNNRDRAFVHELRARYSLGFVSAAIARWTARGRSYIYLRHGVRRPGL